MKSMRMNWRILIPMACILAVLVVTAIVISSIRISKYTNILLDERIAVAANGVKKTISDCKDYSRLAAVAAAADKDVIRAVNERNTGEIVRRLTGSLDLYHVDFFTVTDETGTVLARTHYPDDYSDSVLKQRNVREALKGNVDTRIEEGTRVKVSVRTGAPIYNSDDVLIGVISAGIRFDTNNTLDRLKEHYNADFSVIYNGAKISTTIIKDGNRIIDTLFDPDLTKRIYSTKQESFGNTDIFGDNYSTFYLPLLDENGEVFAIILAGCSNAKLISEKNTIDKNIIILGLSGFAIAIIILSIITTRIVKPVARLSHLVSDVTHGKMDMDIDATTVVKDEIGLLTLDVYSLVEVIKMILSDLSYLTTDLNKLSDVDRQIDTSKYPGSYKEIIEGIKKLASYITTMRKTMAVMDYLDAMISVTDFDYNILYINLAMANKYGIEKENCIGKKCYKAIRKLEQPCDICQMTKLLPDKESYPSIDYDGLRDDTTGIYIGGRAAIIRWIDGEQVFFNSIKDETTKVEYQEQLREAMNVAETANNVKSQFLANMSHEIRTPMNSVLGMTELLLHEDLNSRQLGYVKDMKISAVALLDIINDILDVSKIQAGKLSLIPVHYDFNMLIDNIGSIAHFLIEGKNISFKMILQEQPPVCLFGDDLRLRQVLLNLLNNAAKFTLEGHVLLTVGFTENTVKFTVSDTGIGIPPENMSTLFDAFTQADVLKNRTTKGTGLGLAIVKSIVEMMDGTITVESTYGVGSSFQVEIPKVLGDETLIHYPDEKGNVIYAPYAKILVVDDSLTNLSVACGLLHICQITAETATSGRQAIQMVQQNSYDIVFMDYRMPEMNGNETTRAIRKLGITVPIIALTASADPRAKESMLAAGMNDYLSKPIIKKELINILKKWVPAEKILETRPETVVTDETTDDGHKEFWDRIEKIDGLSVSTGLSMVDGRRDVYEKTLKLLTQEMEKSDKNLIAFLRADDMNNFRIEVHGIKSALANVGAKELSAKALELENASKKMDAAFCISNLPLFLKGLNRLNANLKKAFSAISPSDIPIEIPSGLPPIFEKLINAFNEIDLVLIDKEIENLDALNPGGALKEKIEEIKDAVMMMDYDRATAYINQLLTESA
ncbi:MAG: ATP-binding protein [Acidobacteria bacterium]|nr:ATP-binding protein [Acidobacteriota bacterium]